MKTYCEICDELCEFTSIHDYIEMEVKEKIFNAPQIISCCVKCGGEVHPEKYDDFNTYAAHDHYRKSLGVITIDRIKELLNKYNISAAVLNELLGWDFDIVGRLMKHKIPNKEQTYILESLFDEEEMQKIFNKEN